MEFGIIWPLIVVLIPPTPQARRYYLVKRRSDGPFTVTLLDRIVVRHS